MNFSVLLDTPTVHNIVAGRANSSPGPTDRTGISALKSDAGYFQDGLATRMASVIQSVFTKAGQIVFFSSPP